MKFAIVLLGLVALSAAVPQQRGIVQDIENVVQNFITSAHGDLDKLINFINGFTSNSKGKVDGIISAAKNQISTAIAGVEQTIGTLISKGGVIAVCAQKNFGELTDLKNTVGKNVESCAGNIGDAFGGLETDVLTGIKSLKGSITDLTAIVVECSDNVLEAVVCAISKVNQVKTLVDQIIGSANQAIQEAQAKATVAVAQIQSCAQQTVGEATIQINKFVNAVKQCA